LHEKVKYKFKNSSICTY